MMNMYATDTGTTTYQLRDCCYGEVICRLGNGILIGLEDGTEAFSYTCVNLQAGTKVLCTVSRYQKNELKMLVTVDSIVQYAA